MRKIWWSDFSASEFNDLNPEETIAVLPLAATEQHGPHLPSSTDADIMDGMLNQTIGMLPEAFDIRVYPIIRIGASDEHSRFEGTLSISSQEMIDRIIARGERASIHGVKKMVLINSHGGNEAAMTIAALELRKEHDMMVVKTSWERFGVPDGLFDQDERKLGIHGGDYETSVMLHFAPHLVDMTKAENFTSETTKARQTFKHLAPQSPHGFAWLAGDLNKAGVVGNAAAATAEKGAQAAEHQTRGFLELLTDVRTARLGEWIRD